MNDIKKKKNKNHKHDDPNENKCKKPKLDHPPASNPAVQCLTQLMISKELSDLTIKMTGHNGNFKVHRLVLAMWSSVFKERLFGPKPVGDTIILGKEGDGPAHVEAFECFINYMYTGEAKLTSEKVAAYVYALAHNYIMNHLKTVCSQYLLIHLSAGNAPIILGAATETKDNPLIKRCATLIPESYYSSPKIGSLNNDSLEQLLKQDAPVSSELVIFQGILNWGRLHLKKQKKEISPTTLRQVLEPFLQHVRFLTMSLEEIVKNVVPEHILKDDEILSIQQNIANVPEVSLPSWVSTMRNKETLMKE
ncbi:unnamed protein product, partial [Meganyctiphanes norvegica]